MSTKPETTTTTQTLREQIGSDAQRIQTPDATEHLSPKDDPDFITPKERNRLWPAVRAKLKKEFEARSITSCEMCGSQFGLSMAHRYKRRFINTLRELYIAALLCQPCHQKADEQMTHQEMYDFITNIVEQRGGRAHI